MIITSLQAGGRETVVEYNPGQWCWGIDREGEWDTHVFLGALTLVHTNHWQRRPHFVTKFAAIVVAAWATSTVAHTLGVPDIRGLFGPH